VRCSGLSDIRERNLGRIPGRARAAAYQMDIGMRPSAIDFASKPASDW
jgi:hypothetical protein